jgi:exopolyphosphatase / guanosine-5'-triphosphate,3'-diphosphate pyrophosphatase
VRYAAIDIGSNAVRLLIANILENKGKLTFKKDTLLRVPLRLGDDSFLQNRISARKEKDLCQTITAFSHLMQVFKVSEYMACATSAMRDAGNGQEVTERIRRETGIKIHIINGTQEAGIIYSTHIEEYLDEKKSYLYVDVGGGSTELTVFNKGRMMASSSFNIGTIRMLDNKDTEGEWTSLREWIREYTRGFKPLYGIGTGGNINKLFRLSGEKEDKPITLSKIRSLYLLLNSYSLKERITVLDLNQDRADVIIPACEIYMSVMKWAGVKQMYVPRVGLVDGIIRMLIDKNRATLEKELYF